MYYLRNAKQNVLHHRNVECFKIIIYTKTILKKEKQKEKASDVSLPYELEVWAPRKPSLFFAIG